MAEGERLLERRPRDGGLRCTVRGAAASGDVHEAASRTPTVGDIPGLRAERPCGTGLRRVGERPLVLPESEDRHEIESMAWALSCGAALQLPPRNFRPGLHCSSDLSQTGTCSPSPYATLH